LQCPDTLKHHTNWKLLFLSQVETISDTYMVVSGVPVHNGSRHIVEVGNLSLALLNLAMSFKLKHRPNEKLQLRIGRCTALHYGTS